MGSIVATGNLRAVGKMGGGLLDVKKKDEREGRGRGRIHQLSWDFTGSRSLKTRLYQGEGLDQLVRCRVGWNRRRM